MGKFLRRRLFYGLTLALSFIIMIIGCVTVYASESSSLAASGDRVFAITNDATGVSYAPGTVDSLSFGTNESDSELKSGSLKAAGRTVTPSATETGDYLFNPAAPAEGYAGLKNNGGDLLESGEVGGMNTLTAYGGYKFFAGNNFPVGTAAVLSFPEVDTSVYSTLNLGVAQNVAGATAKFSFSIWENVENGYSLKTTGAFTGGAKGSGADDIAKATISIDLESIAGQDGKISSLVLRLDSALGATSNELPNSALQIYASQFTVSVDLVRFNYFNAAGRLPKLWGGVKAGSWFALDFVETDVKTYPVMEFVYRKNVNAVLNLGVYKNNGTSVPDGDPIANVILDSTSTAKDSSVYNDTFRINLSDFADENGKVSSLLFKVSSEYSGEISLNILKMERFGAGILIGADYVAADETIPAYLEAKGYTKDKSIVLVFPEEIDVSLYSMLSLDVQLSAEFGGGASGDNGADTRRIFESSETTLKLTASEWDGEEGALQEKTLTAFSDKLELDLAEIAGTDGKIRSLALRHDGMFWVNNGETKEYHEMRLSLKVTKVTAVAAPEDYTLNIADGDIGMTSVNHIGNPEFVSGVVHTPSGKIFYNNMFRGTGVEIRFTNPVNSRIYQTLELNCQLKNALANMTFFFGGFPAGTTALAKNSDYAERYMVTTTGTNGSFRLYIDLTKYADQNGMVEGIVLYRANDTDTNLKRDIHLFVFASDVKLAAVSEENRAEQAPDKWYYSVAVEGVSVGTDSEYNLVNVLFDGGIASSGALSVAKETVTNLLTFGEHVLMPEEIGWVTVQNGENGKATLSVAFDKSVYNFGKSIVLTVSGKIAFSETTGELSNYYASEVSGKYYVAVFSDGSAPTVRPFGELIEIFGEDGSDGGFAVRLKFNCPVGSVDVAETAAKILVNGKPVSQSTITVDGSDLVIGSLSRDSLDTIEVQAGISGDSIYVGAEYPFRYLDDMFYVLSEDALYTLWMQDLKVTGDNVTLSVKFSRGYQGEAIADFRSSQLAFIKINGAALSDILSESEGANVKLDGQYLRITLPAGILRFDGSDTIVVGKGMTLPQGGTVPYTTEYKYDDLFREFSVVSSPDAPKILGKEVTENAVKSVHIDFGGYTQGRSLIEIEFASPISYRYLPSVTRPVSKISEQMASIPTINPSDVWLSQMAFAGMTDILTHVYFDGKSIREWMLEDRVLAETTGKKIWDWYVISYVGTGLSDNSAKFQIIFDSAASANLADGKEHTLKITAGLFMPEFSVYSSDCNYKFDPATRSWYGFSEEGEDLVDSGEGNSLESDMTLSGCSGSLDLTGMPVALAMAAAVLIGRKNRFTARKRRNHNEE